MKQKIGLIIFFIGKYLAVQSQFAIGIEAGYLNNHLQTNISTRSFTQNTNGSNLGIGLILNYNLNKKLNFQTQLNFLHKDYSFTRTDIYTGIYEKFKNSYLQIPIIVQYELLQENKWKLFANAGVFVSYWSFASVKGETPNILNGIDSISANGQTIHYLQFTNYSQKYQFNNLKDNRFEFGSLAGLTTVYQLNNNYSIFLTTQFYQSLTAQQKKYMINQIKQFNQTVFISIGCLFMLHK